MKEGNATHSIKQIQAGVAKYIDNTVIPTLVQASEPALVNFCQSRTAQMLGIATPDGGINVEVLRNVCAGLVPEQGLTFSVLGVSVTFTRADVEAIYRTIKEG